MKLQKLGLLAAAIMSSAAAQTRIDLRTQSRDVDFSGASSTKPSKAGTNLPATCSLGETFFKTDAQPGQNLYACTATNLWSVQGGSGAVSSVFGRTGLVAPQSGDYTASQVTNAVDRSAGNTYTAGARQTFVPGSTTSGLRVSPGTLPSAPQVGDVAVDAGDFNRAKVFDGTSWVSMTTVPNYSVPFTSATSVVVPGSSHKMGTANLIVDVYDNRTPAWQVEPDYVLIDPTTYDVTVYFANAQSGKVVISAAGGGGGGLGGAGGVGMAAQLGDFLVTRTSPNILTLGANCSATTPCNVRVGSVVYSVTGSATVTLGSGTGTAYVYSDFSGNLTVGHNLALSCSAGCTAAAGISGFPVNSIPLFTWGATSGAWDSTGLDRRAFLSAKALSAGAGIVTVEAGSQTQVAVDSATVPTYLTATGTLDFPSLPSGTCSELTLALPGATAGDGVAAAWPTGLESGLLGMMRVSAANTIAVRLCNFSGATLNPASGMFRATVVRNF
jgi:hypothetical protein